MYYIMYEYCNDQRRFKIVDDLLLAYLDQSEKIRVCNRNISIWQPHDYELILANISPELERSLLLST